MFSEQARYGKDPSVVLTKRPERIADHLPSDWDSGYPNVWLGSSLDPLDKNGTALFDVPAKIRFLSLEPLLGGVDLSLAFPHVQWVITGGESGHHARECHVENIRSIVTQCADNNIACFVKQMGKIPLDLRRNKGLWPHPTTFEFANEFPGDDGLVRVILRDKKGADMAEFPSDLQVQQFPN